MTGLLLVLLAVPVQSQGAASDLLGRINNLRASLGLAAYRTNAALTSAAKSHAQWMANTQQISHTQPNGSTPRTRAAAAGYPGGWVSENIYGGTNAGPGDAWNFWLNSPIHYRGLTNANYQEIGIGVASGNGWTTFVLVFGNPGTPVVSTQPREKNGSGNSGGNSSAPVQPSFVVGVDNNGNIMHEIQAGHTVGDIALIYGYSWDDVDDMLAINGMTENEIRLLQVGGIFLVPPWEGTYTPTPLPEGYPTLTPESDDFVATAIARANQRSTQQAQQPSATPSPLAAPTELNIAVTVDNPNNSGAVATAQGVPDSVLLAADPTPLTPTVTLTPPPVTRIAAQATAIPVDAPSENVVIVQEGTSPWLIAAVIAQGVIILGAGFEFLRRSRRK